MSYLPYAQSGFGSWLAATGSSVAVHAGIVMVGLGGLQQFFEASEAAQPNTEYTITLEQLDSDTLAGLVERLGTAGAEGETISGNDPDALESNDAEELAALAPEETPGIAADTAEAIEPEALEPEPEPDALEPTPEPETVEESLEAETLEPLPEPETVEATPEAETLEPLPEPETLEALPEPETLEELPEPETLEALPEPETIEALPETETVDAGTAEIADALTPEALAALEPLPPVSSTQPVSPVALGAGASRPESVSAVTPNVAAPAVGAVSATDQAERVTPAPQSIAAVSPSATAVTRVAPSSQTAQAIAPTQSAPQTIAAARPQLPAAAPQTRPSAVPRPPAPPPSAQDLALGDLIRRIRTSAADACLLALPRRDGTEGVGLALIASNDASMETFTATTLTEDDADVRQTRTLIDPRQCPAITYMRQNKDYPATRLGVRLDAAEVPNGGRLTGVLRGTAGKYVTLVLVDNNGVVQDLQRFVSFSGNIARFDVPVTRVGNARDTSQILLAIATQRPANILRERAGQLAQNVFAGLDSDLSENAALAFVTFDVR